MPWGPDLGGGRVRRAAALEAVGVCDHGGEPHAFVLRLAPDGRFSAELDGPLAYSVGFDGTTGWAIGWCHRRETLRGVDLATLQLAQWVWGGLGRSDALRWTVEPRGVADDASTLTLRAGGVEATLEVEAATGLRRRLSFVGAKGTCSHEYLEFADVGGARVPVRWRENEGGHATEYVVERFRRVHAPRFEVPPEPPAYAAFEERGGEVGADVDATGRPLVQVSLDGGSPLWFVLDTGASVSVLDTHAASSRGLRLFGRTTLFGAGGAITARFCRVRETRVGPLALRDLAFVCADLEGLRRACGRPVHGICGYDVLTRCVARVDTSAARVSLHRSDATPWGVPIELRGNVPTLRARFAPDREEDFVLDSGFPGAVLFHEPAVRRLGLTPGGPGADVCEFGGTTRLARTTLPWLDLGHARRRDVESLLTLSSDGAYADPHTAGRIGTALLRDLELVIDYSRRSAAFLRHAAR